MCLSCVLGWPVALKFLGATKDGVLILKHHSVIGEWTPDTPHDAAEGGSRFGSSSMEDLRFALTVLSLHAEDRLDELDLCWGSDTDEYLRWDSDTDEATGWAIRTLIGLTHPAP